MHDDLSVLNGTIRGPFMNYILNRGQPPPPFAHPIPNENHLYPLEASGSHEVVVSLSPQLEL